MLVILLLVVSVTIQTAHNFRKNNNTFAKKRKLFDIFVLTNDFQGEVRSRLEECQRIKPSVL